MEKSLTIPCRLTEYYEPSYESKDNVLFESSQFEFRNNILTDQNKSAKTSSKTAKKRSSYCGITKTLGGEYRFYNPIGNYKSKHQKYSKMNNQKKNSN